MFQAEYYLAIRIMNYWYMLWHRWPLKILYHVKKPIKKDHICAMARISLSIETQNRLMVT